MEIVAEVLVVMGLSAPVEVVMVRAAFASSAAAPLRPWRREGE